MLNDTGSSLNELCYDQCPVFTLCRRFAHLMVKKDVACPETKKDLLRKVKSAISSTAERFSGNMQNVSFPLKLMYMTRYAFQLRLCAHI